MMFSESTTQQQETGTLATATALIVRTLEANPVPIGHPIRVAFLIAGAAGQAGTVVLELNHVDVATIAIGDGEKVAVDLMIRRTSDTQGTVRGTIATDGAVAALEHAPVADLAWTRNQSLRIVGTSDADNGLTLRDYAFEK